MANSWRDVIDFSQSQIHLNPSLPIELQKYLNELSQAHALLSPKPLVWILSSGTSSFTQNSYKLIGLSHDAFLASAQAVNDHLCVTNSDVWLNILPLFHVGGLSISYRSYASNIACHNLWTPHYKWNPHEFTDALKTTNTTLTSLVPTQVYDLVSAHLLAPSPLRAVVVGGAHLSAELYIKARQLGWPLLPSFGMTEAASQIATANLESLNLKNNSSAVSSSETLFTYPKLKLLDHITAKANTHNVLSIKGPSLLEGYYSIREGESSPWIAPKDPEGWYTTQDCATIEDQHLSLQARVDDILKIRGESVNLATLRAQLEILRHKKNISYDCTIVALPDPRLGFQLILVGDASKEKLTELLSLFNSSLIPFERLSYCYGPMIIPKTALGKILHKDLTQQLLNHIL